MQNPGIILLACALVVGGLAVLLRTKAAVFSWLNLFWLALVVMFALLYGNLDNPPWLIGLSLLVIMLMGVRLGMIVRDWRRRTRACDNW